MKNIGRKIFFISLMLVMSGCSLEASIDTLSSLPTDVISGVTSATKGLISGSNQAGTAGEYRVQSSVGSYKSEIQQVTDDGSYYVRGSVQGALAH